MRARAYPSLATLSVLLAACASHGDPSRARAAMLDENRAYSSAFLNHDASAVGARFTDSAVVTFPGMPDVRGRSAIEALFADIFSKVTFKQFTLTPQRLDVYGDAAYEIGTHGEILEPRGGAAQTVQSTYIIVRHHQPDGSWRIERLLVVPGP